MNMSTVRALLMTVMLVVPIFSFGMANTGTAEASLAYGPITQYPIEGGTWNYGFWSAYVRSNYGNNSVCHGSTVILDGTANRSINTSPGYFSYASRAALQAPWHVDEYYYRTC